MKWTNHLCWLLILTLSSFLVQPVAAQTEAAPFGALVLQKGLPAGLPKGFVNTAQAKLKNLQHVVIPTGSESHYVVYYGGEAVEEGYPPQWLWHMRPDSTGMLTTVSFKKNDEGFLSAAFELYTDASEAASMPLELRILPESKVILFRWTGSESGPSGGTAVGKAIDRPVMVGKPLPDFTVESLVGGTLSLDSFKGHPLVINTWAVSCSPCIAEMPGLNQLVEKYERHGFVFLSLGYDSREDIGAFLKKHEFKYKHALFNERTSQLFGEAFPRNVIVNAEGVVVYDHTGANAKQHKQLDEVIQEKILNRK